MRVRSEFQSLTLETTVPTKITSAPRVKSASFMARSVAAQPEAAGRQPHINPRRRMRLACMSASLVVLKEHSRGMWIHGSLAPCGTGAERRGDHLDRVCEQDRD